MASTKIAEKSLGTREILNANHGIIAFVQRETWGSSVTWNVQTVCNGITDYSATFKTRREALADFETL